MSIKEKACLELQGIFNASLESSVEIMKEMDFDVSVKQEAIIAHKECVEEALSHVRNIKRDDLDLLDLLIEGKNHYMQNLDERLNDLADNC